MTTILNTLVIGRPFSALSLAEKRHQVFELVESVDQQVHLDICSGDAMTALVNQSFAPIVYRLVTAAILFIVFLVGTAPALFGLHSRRLDLPSTLGTTATYVLGISFKSQDKDLRLPFP